jgi:20S proteasome alpha/beta subunit
MTLIVGIKCKDGIVLGADGAATYAVMGQSTIRQVIKKKLRLLGTQGIVGVSGPVGIGQRFAGELETIRNQGVPISNSNPPKRQTLDKFKPHEAMGVLRQVLWQIIGAEMDIARHMTQTIGNPSPIHSCLSQSLVCLMIGNEPCLIQFDQQGAPELATEDLPFVAIGSGQLIADPFLAFLRRIYWPNRLPDVDEGVFTTIWALHHAIETHPGGVGPPIQIVTFRQEADKAWRAKEMPEQIWQEHLQFIKSIEGELASVPRKLQEGKAQGPPVPQAGLS